MSSQEPATGVDVAVIGGGQAGLAVGYYLSRLDLRFVILDAHDRIGDAWRRRWDSLRLFTPARLDGLPGMAFPGRGGRAVTKDEMADYLEKYAERYKLPVCLRTRVETLSLERGRFLLRAGERSLEADQVVVATGGHPTPRLPAFAADLNPDIVQLHSMDYRNPSDLRPGAVLVVGAGNSGAEIAMEAAASHRTWLAGRTTGTFNPVLYARPSWWLLKRITDVRTPTGRKVRSEALSKGTPLVRLRERDLAAAGVTRTGRVVGVEDGRPRLEDGQVIEAENVIWCTGFAHDFGWIRLRGIVDGRLPPCERGVVQSQPGLYFVGLPFQSNLASALVDGVGKDAEHIAKMILAGSAGRFSGER